MVDLHVHSYISDGTLSPTEIIKLASDRRIKAVALTDHDSVEGLEEADNEAKRLGVEFIKGIEISTSYGEGRLLHILGLGIDPENTYFNEVYTKMKKAREAGMHNILEILAAQGISIDIEELRKYTIGQYMDRQAIPKYFIDKGILKSAPEVWHRYLDPIPYGEGELLSAEEALSVIKKSGGLSFLAHYNKWIGFEGYTKKEIEEHMEQLTALGLDGLERYYPTFNTEDNEYVEYLMNRYKLIPSGGTDFHGANRPEVSLGSAENNFYIPDEIYERILAKLKSNIDLFL